MVRPQIEVENHMTIKNEDVCGTPTKRAKPAERELRVLSEVGGSTELELHVPSWGKHDCHPPKQSLGLARCELDYASVRYLRFICLGE